MKRFVCLILSLCLLGTSVLMGACSKAPSEQPEEGASDVPKTEGSLDTPQIPSEIPSEIPDQPPVSGGIDYNALNRRDEVMTPMENDYRSRTEVTYSDINGKDVTVYTLYREPDEGMNSPNFAQAVMLYQCIRYKKAHPEEKVVATLSTFHLSVHAAACLDPESEHYGHMKNLYDREYDGEGYYRLVWLLVEAARWGVEVLVIGDMDASDTHETDGSVIRDQNFYQYFLGHLDDPAVLEGKTVGDFMTVRQSDWTAYGDKAATDMMHLKICTVSHYLDNEGKEHGPAVWLGSINVDGVNAAGVNQHNSIQSGIVVTEHEMLRQVMFNYMWLLKDYCGQEDVVPFRNLIISRTTEQMSLIRGGRGEEIALDQLLVYVGSDTDSVFELYFTPMGGAQNQWDTVHNPFCKYLAKLLPAISGEDFIQLIWNNVKYVQSFGLADTMISVIATAFSENRNEDNVLLLKLPGIDMKDFADLPENEHIRINQSSLNYHIKDLQLSYVEDGERHWVVIYNTLNMHEGSMAYQANLILVVHETEETGNDFYTDYAILTTPGTDFQKNRVEAKS